MVKLVNNNSNSNDVDVDVYKVKRWLIFMICMIRFENVLKMCFYYNLCKVLFVL